MKTIRAVSPEFLQAIAQYKTQLHYKIHDVVFNQNDMPKGLYFLEKGIIKLDYTSPEGQVHTLRVFKTGGVFGYRSFFAKEPLHASAVAAADCEVSFVSYAQILEVFKKHPELAFEMLQLLAINLRIAEQKWIAQMDKDTPLRIAEAIYFFDSHFEKRNWTRREIAEWSGTTSETVIRTLALFEKNKLIDQSHGREIILLHKEDFIQQVEKLFKT